MTKKVKTGVIGCGKVGHFHAKAYSKLAESEFCAVFDVQLERAEIFAKEYGVRAFDSIKKMVDETGVEAVSICTPHPVHCQPAVEAADLALNVAVEKPLSSSLDDCDRIIRSVTKAGTIGTTICQRRFYPPSMRIRNAIDEGKLGKPILGTVNMLGWRDMAYYKSDPWRGTWKGEGGGVLVNQAPHQLDLLLWYMGEVEELFGYWDTLNHPDLEVEDTAIACIKFKNGALGNIVVSNSQNPALFGNVRIHGENGASVGVQTDGGAMFIAGVSAITEPPVNDIWTINGENEKLSVWKREDADFFSTIDSLYYFHRQQLGDFLRAIIEKRSPLITLEDGRRTVELFTAIYRSKRDGKTIRFPLAPEGKEDFDGRRSC